MTGREGRLSWEARAEEVSFEVLPKRCNRGTISYIERERVFSNEIEIVNASLEQAKCFSSRPSLLQKKCSKIKGLFPISISLLKFLKES